MATPTVLVQPPKRSPRKGGISSVAEFRPNDRLGVAGGLQYDSDPCSLVVGEIQLCYGPDVDAADKTGLGLDEGTSVVDNFGGYVGVECYAGQTESEYGPRARATLEASQDRVIEAALWGWLTAGVGVAATGIVHAIGLAEDAADRDYVGLPVLHMSRLDAELARNEGVLRREGDQILTVNGTPVVTSGRYTPGTIAVSGGITVEQSSIGVLQGQDYSHNRFLAIAERVYGLIVDCDYRAEYTVTP